MDRLMRRPGAVVFLLAAYFALHVLVRLAMPASLELDEGQQLFFSQSLHLGYDSQPPFYNWLQWGAVQLFGVSVAALSVLKNLLLFLSFLFLGMTANLLLRDKALAAIATLGLMTITQISFEAERDLTHTVAVLFSACLFLYAVVKTLEAPAVWTYLLTGIAAGVGMLSKYNFALLPLAALIAILPDRDFRARLLDWRILLTVAVGAVIVAPHAWWFLQHVDIATHRTLGKLIEQEPSRIEQIAEGLGGLAGAVLAFGLPPLVVFGIAFGRQSVAAWRDHSPASRLLGRMFAAIVVLLVLLVLFAGASDIRPRWLVPFFFALPLWLCLKIEAGGTVPAAAPGRFGAMSLIVMAAVPLILGLRAPVMGTLGRYQRPNVPYGPAIEAILAAGKDRPALIAAADQQFGGNARLHAPDIAVAVPGFAHLQPAYRFDATHPVLLLWRGRGEPSPSLPKELSGWLSAQPGLTGVKPEIGDIGWRYHFGKPNDRYHFGYAWLYPATTPE
jgi:4-amino-4-deoxy-L-arabinose transferase-like glycosyltransferase